MTTMDPKKNNLGDFLEYDVTPRLTVEAVFTSPAHAWKKNGPAHFEGGCPWHESRGGQSFQVDMKPGGGIVWHCFGCNVGGGPAQYIHRMNGGTGTPRGVDFLEVVRELAKRAGVEMPEKPQDVEHAAAWEARKSALERVTAASVENLWTGAGGEARDYLHTRGLDDNAIKDLELGLYPPLDELRPALAGYDTGEGTAALFPGMVGYVSFPWRDATGRVMTIAGRWPGDKAPGNRPKSTALPGEHSKAVPLYFDRARRDGHRALVAVEGLLDAAILQAQGETRTVAYVGAGFTQDQVETLRRYKVRDVVIVPDPDTGGEKGTQSSVNQLYAAGISARVADIPEAGLDPDDYVKKHGLDAWRALVKGAVSGGLWLVEKNLKGITPASSDVEKRAAIRAAGDTVNGLAGFDAALDRDAALTVIESMTGYSSAAINDAIESAAEQRKEQAARDTVRAALIRAQAALVTGDPAEVAADLARTLAKTRTSTEPPPPAFNVTTLWSESLNLPAGIVSPWPTLNETGVQFCAGELALIAGRTGHAKTSFLMALADHFIDQAAPGEVVLIYSHEEMTVRVFHRLLALRTSSWTPEEIRDYAGGTYNNGNVRELDAARTWWAERQDRVVLVHRPGWDTEKIRAHVIGQAENRTIKAVLVDYLQRIPPPAGKYDRRDIQISAIGRDLHDLAGEIKAPVIVGAQVNREAVPDKYKAAVQAKKDYAAARDVIRTARPALEHLREGGSEQEADLVLGLLNYAADYKRDETNLAPPAVTRFEVIALKNRYGEPGQVVTLAWEGRRRIIREPKFNEQEANL